MYCKKCGKEINDYTRFCASCGTPVGSTGNKVNAGNPFLNNSRPTTNNSYSSGRVSYISPLALIVAISTIVAAFIGTIGWLFLPLLKIKEDGVSKSFSLFRLFDLGIDPSEAPLMAIGLLVFGVTTIIGGIFFLIAIVRLIKKNEAKACMSLRNMLIGNAVNYIFSLLMNMNIQSEYFGSYSEYVHISGFVILMLLVNIGGAIAVTIISEDHL